MYDLSLVNVWLVYIMYTPESYKIVLGEKGVTYGVSLRIC